MPAWGSFEKPPIVVTSSRRKALIGVAFGLILLFGAGIQIVRHQATALTYFGAAFFSLCVVVLIWRLCVPARLVLARQGLTWFTGVKTWRFSWRDFDEFKVFKPPHARTWHIGFTYAPGSAKNTKSSARLKKHTGLDGGFGCNWDVETRALAAILNTAKTRWADVRPTSFRGRSAGAANAAVNCRSVLFPVTACHRTARRRC